MKTQLDPYLDCEFQNSVLRWRFQPPTPPRAFDHNKHPLVENASAQCAKAPFVRSEDEQIPHYAPAWRTFTTGHLNWQSPISSGFEDVILGRDVLQVQEGG